MQLKDEQDIIKLIMRIFPKPKKIVEVGVGKLPEIAVKLAEKLPKTEIIATDINIQTIQQIKQRYPQIKFVQDDITRPDIKIYQNSDLIYSIRPPPELTPYLLKLAKKVGATLIIRPLSSETHEIQTMLEKSKITCFKKTTLILVLSKIKMYENGGS